MRTGTAPPTSRSPASAGATSGPPEAAAIARNLEAIDIESGHTTKTVANRGAEALNAILPRNVDGKSTRYREGVNADRALSGANVAVDKASRDLAAAQARYIQMAGGKSGDTLSVFLDGLKNQHPQVFQETLQNYGIDVESGAKGPEIGSSGHVSEEEPGCQVERRGSASRNRDGLHSQRVGA